MQPKLEAERMERYLNMCHLRYLRLLSRTRREGLLRGRGKSEYEVEMKDCVCVSCPVFDEMRLSDRFYCIHGSAK